MKFRSALQKQKIFKVKIKSHAVILVRLISKNQVSRCYFGQADAEDAREEKTAARQIHKI